LVLLLTACLLMLLAAAGATGIAGDTPPYAASVQKRAAAAEALGEIDRLLKTASDISGLPVRSRVKSAISSREEVQRYIQQRLRETFNARQMHLQELALKKFGFIPLDYPLQSSMEHLLTEQAAAYYDPRRKEIYVADWTPIEVQKPAIVHELTHALQDQAIKLDAFLDDKKLGEDEQMARTAVVEGQAVLVMIEYMLSASGVPLESLPNLNQIMSQATVAEVSQFPVFASAPPYLRETLLFPYTAGMRYARWMNQKEGKSGYLAALKNPPQTTAQVMHPGEPAPPGWSQVQTPKASPVPAGYEYVGDGMLGELDVQILLRQYCGAETAGRLAPAWRGLRYAVYEDKKQNRAFLLHRSRWTDPKAAAEFAEAYKKVLEGKGERNSHTEVTGDTVLMSEGLP
jgi:hypothetical protein